MKDGVPETTLQPARDSLGKIMLDNLNNPIMKPVQVFSFGRFLCFDYEFLKNRYGLRLERFTSLQADDIEEQEEENDEKKEEYKQGDIF
jgi:hypothetical protein